MDKVKCFAYMTGIATNYANTFDAFDNYLDYLLGEGPYGALRYSNAH
jgi:hypothetical protein